MWALEIGTICHFGVRTQKGKRAHCAFYSTNPMNNSLAFVNRPHTGTICHGLCSCSFRMQAESHIGI